jgi:hypothetical protein
VRTGGKPDVSLYRLREREGAWCNHNWEKRHRTSYLTYHDHYKHCCSLHRYFFIISTPRKWPPVCKRLWWVMRREIDNYHDFTDIFFSLFHRVTTDIFTGSRQWNDLQCVCQRGEQDMCKKITTYDFSWRDWAGTGLINRRSRYIDRFTVREGMALALEGHMHAGQHGTTTSRLAPTSPAGCSLQVLLHAVWQSCPSDYSTAAVVHQR